jgi:hypothetical protein
MSNLGGTKQSEDTDRNNQSSGTVTSVSAGTNVTVTGTATDPVVNADTQNNAKVTTKGDLEGFSTVAARIPVGTNGQVLEADSTQALGLKWATPSAGGDVSTDAIFDAKGDLPGGTGADTAARLPVGTNDQVLTADSAEATGMKWATAAAGGAAVVSFHGAKIERSTSLARTDATDEAAMLTEVYDTDGFADLGTESKRLTIPSGVTKVRCTVHLDCVSNTGSKRLEILHLNSSDAVLRRYGSSSASTPDSDIFGIFTTPVVEVSLGDYFIVSSDSSDTSWTQEYVSLSLEYKDGTLVETVASGSGAPAAMISRSTSQSMIASDIMEFTTEDYDDNTFADLGTANDRFTIPAGVTRVNLSSYMQASSVTAGARLQTYISQADVSDVFVRTVSAQEFDASDTTPRQSNAGVGIPCSEGDYFRVLTVSSDASWTITVSHFTIQDVSP